MLEKSATIRNALKPTLLTQSKQSRGRLLLNSLKSTDLFSERFRMRLDDGEASISTVTGALCSLLIVILLVLYFYLKLDVLVYRKDVDVLSTLKDYQFDD